MSLGQRLDALLQRLDNTNFSQGEEYETEDFLNFLDEDNGQLDQEADLANVGSEEDIRDQNLSDEDISGEIPSEAPISTSAEPSTPDEESSKFINEQQLNKQQPIKKVSDDKAKPKPSETRRAPIRRGTAASKAEIDNNASENQRLRRSLRDVEAYIVKPRTVESFIAELEDSDGENEEDKPKRSHGHNQDEDQDYEREHERERDHHEMVLLSSPPKMQGLRSFLETAHDSSDSELEIIPETKKNRMSKPVRDMLRLGGNNTSTSTRKLAQMKQNLAKLQAIQISQRREANRQKLEQNGLDVASLEKEMEASRAKAGGTYAWLEEERKKAEKYAEHDSNNDDNSDEEVPVNADSSEGDLTAARVSRKLVLSDDDDDDDQNAIHESASAPSRQPASIPVSAPVSAPAAGHQDTQYMPPISQPALARMLDESNSANSGKRDNIPAGHTGTQYVEPVSEAVMAKMLDLDDTAASSTQYVAPVSNTVMAEMLGIDEEDAEGADEATDSGLDNPGEIPGESEPEFEAPDLSDITGTFSQRIAEVRKRYLARKARERLEAEQKKHAATLVEDEAEESDEEGGAVPREDGEGDVDSDQDVELEELVNRSHVNVKESEVHRKFAEDERLRDEKLLGRLVQGINGRGFRRDADGSSGPGGLFLGEDVDESGEDAVSLALKAAAATRRQKLLQGNSRAAKLASNVKASAFFTSISEDLVARPGARPKNTIEEGLQYLRSVECNPANLPGVPANTSAAAASTDASGPFDSVPAPPIKISVRRTSTIASTGVPRVRGGTYASSISTADVGNKSVDILQSLGGAKQTNKKPQRQFVAPIAPPLAKKRQVSGTAPASAVFGRRSWA